MQFFFLKKNLIRELELDSKHRNDKYMASYQNLVMIGVKRGNLTSDSIPSQLIPQGFVVIHQ